MSTKKKSSPESIVREIKRKTRRKYSAEEKIRIVLEGLRGEQSITDLSRREGIHPGIYYKWSKAFLEADNVYCGLVQYIDYDRDWLPEGYTFLPFLHKRKSFAHEREVRIVHQDLPKSDRGISVGVENSLLGITIPVNLDLLIGRVYVAPTSSSKDPNAFTKANTYAREKFDGILRNRQTD